jgi:hypothetical protein
MLSNAWISPKQNIFPATFQTIVVSSNGNSAVTKGFDSQYSLIQVNCSILWENRVPQI